MLRSIMLVLMAATLLAVPAFAGSVSTEVNGLVGGSVVLHDSDTSPTGSVFSFVPIGQPFGADTGLIQPPNVGDDDAILYAVASDNGAPDMQNSSQVLLDTWMFDGSADWVFNGSAVNELTVTNNTATDAQFLYYYTLSEGFLGITDYDGSAVPVYLGYSAEILVDGASQFSASSALFGDLEGGITTATTLPSPLASVAVGDPAHQAGYVAVGDAGVIDLGILAPGESRNVVANLYGFINTAGFELGGALNIGLDGAVRSIPIDNPNPPIPEPATVALLGMGALGVLLRRRKTNF